jgi:hypothetical protein
MHVVPSDSTPCSFTRSVLEVYVHLREDKSPVLDEVPEVKASSRRHTSSGLYVAQILCLNRTVPFPRASLPLDPRAAVWAKPSTLFDVKERA